MRQNLRKWLLLTLTLLAVALTETSMAQNSCASPSTVTVDSPLLFQSQSTGKFWYSFVATSDNIFLNIVSNDSTFFGIDSIVVYENNCDNLFPKKIAIKSLTDTLNFMELHLDSLTISTQYLIKISKQSYITVNYDIYLFKSAASACNLVNNSDFNVPSPCPSGPTPTSPPGTSFVNGWVTNGYSPDFIHACNSSSTSSTNPNIPVNGFISVTSGNGYIGMYTGTPGGTTMEYATGSMVPMTTGKKYYVSMQYAKKPGVKYSVNHLGMSLSNGFVANSNPWGNPFAPTQPWQIINPNNSQLNNTTWNLMGSCYQATGGESFVTIGNPNSIASTTYSNTNPTSNNPNAYYLIDDVQSVPLDLDISPSLTICIGSAATLTTSLKCPLPLGVITNTAGVITNSLFVWTPTVGLSVTTGTTTVASPTATTIYTITLTIPPVNSNGSACTITNTVQVTVVPNPTVLVSATPSTTICAGNSVTLTASGASTYTWNPGAISGTSIIITPTANITYTANGTNTFGCADTETIIITVTPSPTITANSTTICSGGIATLTASGASTYTWNPGSLIGTSVNVTPTITTSYTVTGTASGCTNTKTVTVTVNPTPTVSASASSTAICTGSSTTLTASGALSYTWNPSALTGSTVNITPTVTTIYTVTGTNTYGCTGTNTVMVNVTTSPPITSIPSSNSVCPGSSATLTAIGGTTYTWSPASTLNTANGSSVIASPTVNTVYTVSATTEFCGIKTNTVLISIIPTSTIIATASPTAVCPGFTTSLTASGAFTYTWNPGGLIGTTIAITPTLTTTYTVQGANSCGAISTQTVKVTLLRNPIISASASPTYICTGSTTTLTMSGGGIINGWLEGVVWGTTGPVSPSVTTTYTASSTGSNGCSNNAVVTVSVGPFSSLTVNPSTICVGQTATLTASGATTYTWNTGSNAASFTVSPTTTTNYTVSGTGGSCSAATVTLGLTVNSNPTVTASASPTTICPGSSSTLTASGASTYLWLPVNSISNPLTVSPAITTIYTVTGTNSSGCINTKTLVLTISPNPTVTIAATKTIICIGDTPTLTASGANTYSWSTGEITASIAVTPTVETTYTVTGITGDCSSTKTITIITFTPPIIEATASPSIICSGSSSTLTASGSSSFTWQPMYVYTPSVSVSPTSTSIYTVTGENQGCSRTQTVSLTVVPIPTISAIAGPSVACSGGSSTITASGATTYSWNTGATTTTIVVTPTVATSYTVTGNNGNCAGNTETVTVNVGTTPTITATASSTSMCVGNTATLSASGATSYSWTSGETTASITVTPGAVNIYTVTGTTGGCSATSTVEIALIGQYCCQTASFTIGTSTTSNISYANNSNGGGAVIDMQGTITFTANSSMSDYIIRMAPQTLLNILPGITVTFSNCTLYSCTELWNGINIPHYTGTNAGNLNVINSTIEDMYNGIVLSGPGSSGWPISPDGIINITNSKLNKNYISIMINNIPKYNNGTNRYGLAVTGSTISSVYSATSPLNTLKYSSAYTYAYNTITNTSVPYTYFPRGFAGIMLYQLTEDPVYVGDETGTGGTNRFENLDIGIWLENATLRAHNNHFVNIKGSSKQYPFSPPSGPDEIGLGIQAINSVTTGIQYYIIAGNGTSTPSGGNPFPAGNKFEDCYKGVKVDNFKGTVKIQGNVFTSTVTTTTPLSAPSSPLYSYRSAQSGIWVTNTQIKAELLNNYVLNHKSGIYSSHNILAVHVAGAYIKVEDNLVEAPGITGYCKQAIQVDQVTSTTNLNTGMLTVKNNTIQNVYGGIKAYNVKAGLQINSNPTINLDAEKLYGITGSVINSSTYARTGIYVQSCTDAVVANNPNITSNGTIPTTYSTVKGIWMNGSSGTAGQVNCNTISNMGRCMQFQGTSLNKVSKNVMNGTYQGLVLSVNGQIGDQGHSTTTTHDNEWSGFTGGAAQYAETYTESSSTNANTNSRFFVQSGSPYQPTQNYSNNGNPYSTGLGVGIDVQTGLSGESCLSLRVMGESIGAESNAMRMSSANDSTNTLLYESLASDTAFYEVYQNETQYRNKQLVYELLNKQSIDTTKALNEFYAANQTGNYQTLIAFNEAIAVQDYQIAQSINSSITTNSAIEGYQKRMNELVLKYLSYQSPIDTALSFIPVLHTYSAFNEEEITELKTIANSCLDQYGNVVTQARVLVNNVLNTLVEFEENCNPVYNQRKGKAELARPISSVVKTKLYPNPNNGNMLLEYDLGNAKEATMSLFDVTGKLMIAYKLESTKGTLLLNEQTLLNGIYFYHILVEGKIVKTDKIVIIK